jgi:hypothetical protein
VRLPSCSSLLSDRPNLPSFRTVSPGSPFPDFNTHNKLEGKGHIFIGKQRRARWESLERVVKEAEEALKERKKAV